MLAILEGIHYSHGDDEPCPDDGTCVQVIVRKKMNYGGLNGWCHFWTNTSQGMAEASMGLARLSLPAKPKAATTEATDPKLSDNPSHRHPCLKRLGHLCLHRSDISVCA